MFIDVETTGVNPNKNGIIQLACLIEIDGKVVDKCHLKIKPFEKDVIEQSALDTVGVTLEEIMQYEDPTNAYWQFRKMLEKYINVYDKNKANKFIPVGYNVQFDLDFLDAFFRKNQDKYIGSFFNWRKLDVLQMFYWRHYLGIDSLESYKLEKVCEKYKVPLEAHDAFNDIVATRTLFKMLEKQILFTTEQEGTNGETSS